MNPVPANSEFSAPEHIVLPQHHAAQQTGFIRYNRRIFWQVEVNLFAIPAANVEVVPVEGVRRLLNSFLQIFVPLLLSVFIQPAASDVILIGRLLPRMVAKFQPWTEP